MFKRSYPGIVFAALLILLASNAFARSDDNVWREVNDSKFSQRPVDRFIAPDAYKTFRLNKDALDLILRAAPAEQDTIGKSSTIILTLPMPDGSFQKFAIKESPIMEPELAAKFPEFKTYLGQGLDNPTATTRFDLMPNGFHAMILSDQGTVYIDPYSKTDSDTSILPPSVIRHRAISPRFPGQCPHQ